MQVYLVIKGHKVSGKNGEHQVSIDQTNTTNSQLTVHQIHLHGHDFAILQQHSGEKFPKGLNLKKDNPLVATLSCFPQTDTSSLHLRQTIRAHGSFTSTSPITQVWV